MEEDIWEDYSVIAEEQLDIFEQSKDFILYNKILEVCQQILDDSGQVRVFSSSITTKEGIRFYSPIPGGYPNKVFWSINKEGLVRVEAIFPYFRNKN